MRIALAALLLLAAAPSLAQSAPVPIGFHVEGGELLVEEGWVSDRYGVRERASVLVARTLRSFPASLAYTVTPRRAGGQAPRG